jgi:hypothetical protein
MKLFVVAADVNRIAGCDLLIRQVSRAERSTLGGRLWQTAGATVHGNTRILSYQAGTLLSGTISSVLRKVSFLNFDPLETGKCRQTQCPHFADAETFTAGARTLPQPYLVSPEIFASRSIFRSMACVGHQSQVENAGVTLPEVAGESLVILRSGGDVRAFYSVCRLRGAACETKAANAARRFNVPIMRGRMAGRSWSARRTGQVEGFDKAELSLHPVRRRWRTSS